MDDIYRNPGPLQFDGPGGDLKATTLCVEDRDYMGRIKLLEEYLNKVPTFSSLYDVFIFYACQTVDHLNWIGLISFYFF